MTSRGSQQGESQGNGAVGDRYTPGTGADRPSRDGVEMKLRGPGVTIEETFETAQQLKRLLGSVAEELGAPKGAADAWQIRAVYFQCDGCGLRRPDRPGPDEGWTYRDGDDLCPACSGGVA